MTHVQHPEPLPLPTAESRLADSIPAVEGADQDVEGAEEGHLNATLASRIRLEKADRSLSEFKRWYDDGDLVLNPEWQRNYVWTKPQASKLIESFLLGIPIPVVYLSLTPDQKYEVIDGLQRLATVFDYFNSKFPLSGLDVLQKLNGKRYKQLDEQDQKKLRNSTLRSFELSSETDSNIHFLVFERLNTGGTKLNDMEIRNCIFRGRLNNLIKELAEFPAFVDCVSQSALAKRMHDRGLVLRFLAFHERTHTRCKHGLKRFLNEFLETYRDPNDNILKEYKRVFKHCLGLCLSVFGDRGFRLRSDPPDGSHSSEWATRINASVFQCVATSFADYSKGQITRAADSIREEYIDLVTTDSEWVDRVRRATGESKRLEYVFSAWKERLSDLLRSVSGDDRQRCFSRELKRELFDACPRCRICGNDIAVLDDAAIDHIQHYWRGGATIPENARLVHRFCNASRALAD